MAFAMCEGVNSLKLLENWESKGQTVVNSPKAVKNCYRHRMLPLLNHGTLPFPKTLLIQTSESVNGQFNLGRGVWVKRGDVHSTQPGDVELIFDRPSLEKTLESMRSRWVDQAILQEHVHGDLIKFYGVRSQGWFRHFYHKPEEKMGFPFSLNEIRETAELAALKNEVKLESRQVKTALEQFRELFDTLQRANTRLGEELNQQREREANTLSLIHI